MQRIFAATQLPGSTAGDRHRPANAGTKGTDLSPGPGDGTSTTITSPVDPLLELIGSEQAAVGHAGALVLEVDDVAQPRLGRLTDGVEEAPPAAATTNSP